MRMAKCPMCGKPAPNGFKKGNKWYSKCYNKECGYTTEVGMPTRKMSRFNWNLNYERLTGETLPDEMTGRQKGAYMKKEIRCGVPELVQCFSQEDFEKWEEKYDYKDINWVKVGGKKAGAARRKARAKERAEKEQK